MNTNTKKKLYISCPMKGRTEEAIRHDMNRMHKAVHEYTATKSYTAG